MNLTINFTMVLKLVDFKSLTDQGLILPVNYY